ncbi:hypothetical protein K438DRAFT_1904994 [Mycena galopus ATCC 62051]|nr:hypothetical protein K438DRAFT_1904994 [Mycena galopus ATCC 62051]
MADEGHLERAIFGGSDSELSDEDQEPQKVPQRRKSPSRHRQDEFESSEESVDDYVQQKRVIKPKKRTKTRKSTDDARPTQGKRKRKAPEPVDLSQLPPEQANKIRLDMQIEAILKPKKSNRPKKRKGNEEVLDSFADDEVARLREAMNNAADEDLKANDAKLPAVAKLKMLPEAMETLRKGSLAQSIIDNNLLEAVKLWLEPLRDPRHSGHQPHRGDLVSTWSRPIIKRSASYRDRIIPTAQQMEGSEIPPRTQERFNAIMAKGRAQDKDRVRKNAVSIPRSELPSYTVAPSATGGMFRANQSVDADIERRKKNAERIKSLTRKVTAK